MSGTKVLLLGGHGKISLLMTPLMLHRSWHVTSVIRDPKQTAEIESKGKDQSGKIDVLVESLDDITSEQKAQSVIDRVKPEYVVWSAGAGGKGGASRTYAVDRDAARHFITAAARTSSVKKFLLISYIGSRRNRAPWFTDDDWAAIQKVNSEALPDYAMAKVEADECLYSLAKQRRDKGDSFHEIVLRPGTLTDKPAKGTVSLGHTRARGDTSRAEVADVAVKLLESEYRGYIDMLDGDEPVEQAISRVLRERIDCFEGEDTDVVVGKYKL